MLNRRTNSAIAPVVVALAALLAISVLVFSLYGFGSGSVFAQEGPIQYAENGETPVRTFMSTDPERRGINWDVTGIDADDFEISSRGVLTFKTPPNYEAPTDRQWDVDASGDITAATADAPAEGARNNMYEITVRASEKRENGRTDRALSTETHVTVEVTNVNEDGSVTIDLRQPEVGTAIMASVTDPEGTTGTTASPDTVDWQWSVSTVTNPVATANNHWSNATGAGNTTATYTPHGDHVDGLTSPRTPADANAVVDEGKYLRVSATYTDSHGEDKTIYGVSEFPVRAEVGSESDDGVSNPANGSPGFTQGLDYTRTVSESLGVGMNVGAPVVAIDPQSSEPNDRGPDDPNHDPTSDKLTYEVDNNSTRNDAIAETEDASYFSIDKATGQLKVRKTLDWDNNPNRISPDGKYVFTVRAIDPSGEIAEQEVTVTATAANDAPKVMGSRTDAQQTADAAIPAAPSEVRVLEQDSDDRISPAGPDATYYGTPDGLEGTAGEAMGLPVALALGNQNVFTAPDDDDRGQIFWDLKGEDKDVFVLTQGGQTGTQGTLTGPDEPIALVFITPPDYENPTDADGDSVYKVVLEARDSGGLTDSRPITIFVDNVAEQGEATLSATGNGIDQPTIGSKIVADVVDPDGGVAVLTWQWSRTKALNDPINNPFTIINGETSSEYTPAEADDGYYLRATATYIDTTSDVDDPETEDIDERVQNAGPPIVAKTAHTGDGVTNTDGTAADADTDKVFRVMVTSKFAVRVAPGAPPSATAPAFPMATYERELVENAEVGSIVGAPVEVTSQTGVTFRYDLDATTTNANNFFTIDEHGQIKVGEIAFRTGRAGIIYPAAGADATPGMEDPVLDYEETNTFNLVVTATDTANSQRKATADVTITLTDLNETPYFDKASRDAVSATIDYAETRVNRVVPLAVTEPDGDSLRWEVAGTDASDFEIRDVSDIGDGKDRRDLHFKSQPDYESPTARNKADDASRDERNQYSVIVRAIETTAVGGGPNQAAELAVTVQVSNSDESGKVEIKWLQPEVGTALPATLIDPDGNPDAALPLVMADSDTEIDADTNVQSWQWYRAKNSNPNLTPDIATLGTGTSDWETITGGTPTEATYTPQGKEAQANGAPSTGTAVDEGWKLLVKAEYTDGEGTTKSAIGVTYLPVRADVHDDQNNSPDFRNDTAARSVPENAVVGANVGARVRVDTNEDNDTLTYTLDNDKDPATSLDEAAGTDLVGNAVPGTTRGDVSYFTIDKNTGQIKVAKPLDWDNNPPPDMDADGQYVLWVRATDPSGEADEDNDYIKVTITATNVNDAPKVTDGLAEISINEVDSSKMDSDINKFVGLGYEIVDGATAQSLIATNPNLYHRSDEDRVDRGIWPDNPIAGPDGALFEYSTPNDGIGRRLHFKRANLPDYENPLDANRDNVYEVTVTVRDNGRATGTKNVRITVMNVDEPGKLVLTPEQPHDGAPVTATLTDDDGVEIITNWTWYTAATRFTKVGTDTSAIRDADGNIKTGVTPVPGATTNEHTGAVGQFLWAEVDYRDGKSVEDDPVTALDERNDDPGTDTATEHHKFQGLTDDDPPVLDTGDTLFHNSDLVVPGGADNAVRKDPTGGTGSDTPSTDVVEKVLTVYENVASTGYVGIPLDGLSYPDGQGGTGIRDTIGGPDGASFVFAEGPPLVTTTGATNYDGTTEAGFYDSVMVGSDDIPEDTTTDPVTPANPDPNDKMGQLAANVVTHFDAEGLKKQYIIEVTDPDAEVAVGPVRVTITVVSVNEAPSAPEELRGTPPAPNSDPEFTEGATADRRVQQGTAADENIGTPIEATDADADTLTYTLGGTDMASFAIDSATGQLMTTAASAALATGDYEVTVTADDGEGGSATITVTIMVTVGTTGNAVADQYDDDGNGIIDGDEVLNAVDDYFADPPQLTEDQILDIVDLYFSN